MTNTVTPALMAPSMLAKMGVPQALGTTAEQTTLCPYPGLAHRPFLLPEVEFLCVSLAVLELTL